jgi:hypothetical protein
MIAWYLPRSDAVGNVDRGEDIKQVTKVGRKRVSETQEWRVIKVVEVALYFAAANLWTRPSDNPLQDDAETKLKVVRRLLTACHDGHSLRDSGDQQICLRAMRFAPPRKLHRASFRVL